MVGGGLHSLFGDPGCDSSQRSLASLLLLRDLLELSLAAENLLVLDDRILRLLALVLDLSVASGQSRSLSSGSPTASGV